MSAPRLLSNRYELGDTLGYGGMSEVHHAHDVRLGREVAVKILRADLARDPQFQERFRREAQNAAALNHPAIVAVYDTGEAGSEYGPLPYIVMEFVEGRTLRDIVKTEGPMPQKRAMEVMADVCAALDFSHRHGIVHRDVKPANVMITRNGAVKVMDFGIARAIHDNQSAMTQTAAVIGTAQYLSPEQARGESVDARSDVYAAGCVLYELITGQPPFTGDSPVAVAYQHVREDPQAPSVLNPGVSPELDAVVLKALAKGPANRYQSAAEMRSDLVRALSGQRPSAPMVMSADERTQVMNSGHGRQDDYYDDYDPDAYDAEDEAKRRRKRRWLAAALVVLGIGAVAFVMWLADVFDPQPEPVAVPTVVGQPEPQARQTLMDRGFQVNAEPVPCRPEPGGQPACTAEDIGKVISTDPAAGEMVAPKSEVLMRVGAAPKQVQVPNLVGKTQQEAEALLRQSDLMLDPNVKEVEVEDPAFYGKVIEGGQRPAANTQAQAGTSVTITIGKSPQLVEVKDYTGETVDVATAGLEGAGFEVVRKNVDSDKPQGQVLSQSPNSGKHPEGSTVTLEVSNGSQQTIQMPDLTGLTESQARSRLQERGWTGELVVRRERVADPDDAGKVTNQQPAPGNQLRKDQTVTIIIGERPGEGSSTSSSIDLPIPN